MTIREQNIERYDAYLEGRLSADLEAGFEQRMAEDAELKLDFDKYKQEVFLIKSLGIRDELSDIMKKEPSVKKGISIKYLIPVRVAAALALVWLFLPSKTVEPDLLFDEYFTVYPNAITSRATEGDVYEALASYERREYKKAIGLFNDLADSDTVSFYRSLSQLELRLPEQAVSGLSSIERSSIFYNPSIWYRGLGFLLTDHRDSAIYYLRQVEKVGPNQEAAREILDQLN
ncbi:MAG: hypothetical protein HEP71_21985 [Roseivirga sp.]|nr:hypothetical protein [Roseivirga sp.]